MAEKECYWELVRTAEPIVRMAHHLHLLTPKMMRVAEEWMREEEACRYALSPPGKSPSGEGGQAEEGKDGA